MVDEVTVATTMRYPTTNLRQHPGSIDCGITIASHLYLSYRLNWAQIGIFSPPLQSCCWIDQIQSSYCGTFDDRPAQPIGFILGHSELPVLHPSMEFKRNWYLLQYELLKSETTVYCTVRTVHTVGQDWTMWRLSHGVLYINTGI